MYSRSSVWKCVVTFCNAVCMRDLQLYKAWSKGAVFRAHFKYCSGTFNLASFLLGKESPPSLGGFLSSK